METAGDSEAQPAKGQAWEPQQQFSRAEASSGCVFAPLTPMSSHCAAGSEQSSPLPRH